MEGRERRLFRLVRSSRIDAYRVPPVETDTVLGRGLRVWALFVVRSSHGVVVERNAVAVEYVSIPRNVSRRTSKSEFRRRRTFLSLHAGFTTGLTPLVDSTWYTWYVVRGIDDVFVLAPSESLNSTPNPDTEFIHHMALCMRIVASNSMLLLRSAGVHVPTWAPAHGAIHRRRIVSASSRSTRQPESLARVKAVRIIIGVTGQRLGSLHSRIHAFTHSLARTRQDETVLFDPVAAAPDALNVVYAYPNEYTVGITSLGYQLVWAYLETSELTSVSRRCGYCNSIARRSLDAHSTQS